MDSKKNVPRYEIEQQKPKNEAEKSAGKNNGVLIELKPAFYSGIKMLYALQHIENVGHAKPIGHRL